MKPNRKAVVITTLKWRLEHETSGAHHLLSKQFCQILTGTSGIYCKSLLSQNLHLTFLRMPTASPLFNHLPSTVECFLSSSCLIKLKRGEKKLKKGGRQFLKCRVRRWASMVIAKKTYLPTRSLSHPTYFL